MGLVSKYGCIASAFLGCVLLAGTAAASGSEEVLIRKTATFIECPAMIEAMLKHLGADTNHVSTISDTGAHYYIELASFEANLEFRCNAVTEQIEIVRVTPGTLNELAVR